MRTAETAAFALGAAAQEPVAITDPVDWSLRAALDAGRLD
jgi:hypothetical protein